MATSLSIISFFFIAQTILGKWQDLVPRDAMRSHNIKMWRMESCLAKQRPIQTSIYDLWQYAFVVTNLPETHKKKRQQQPIQLQQPVWHWSLWILALKMLLPLFKPLMWQHFGHALKMDSDRVTGNTRTICQQCKKTLPDAEPLQLSTEIKWQRRRMPLNLNFHS